MKHAHVAAVVPAYNVGRHLAEVLQAMPLIFRTIVVVDDASRDDTRIVAERCAHADSRIVVVHHDQNRGVGGAMLTGYAAAIERGADVLVKIDGDGQMPLALVPQLIEPLLNGTADYTKGNRFRDFEAIRSMPFVRKVGNVVLSFFSKAATGYWQCFDPANGFVAIRTDVLAQLPVASIDRTYFFETSMLSNLYMLSAVVKEIPMPARYAGETSSLSITNVVSQFPGKLLWSLLRRVTLKHFVYDFNIASFHLLLGLPLLLAGLGYGGYEWWWYSSHGLAAPTGTVVLPALAIVLGAQLLLSAVNLDLQNIPREPINRGALRGSEATIESASRDHEQRV